MDIHLGWLHRLEGSARFGIDQFSDHIAGRSEKFHRQWNTDGRQGSLHFIRRCLSQMSADITIHQSATVRLIRNCVGRNISVFPISWGILQESSFTIGDWKYSRVENPLWHKMALTWPVDGSGTIIRVGVHRTDLRERLIIARFAQELQWPLEGCLIPGVPSIKAPRTSQGKPACMFTLTRLQSTSHSLLS